INYVKEKFDSGRIAHITAPGGTDLWIDVTDRKPYTCSGICKKPGMRMGLPDLEVFIAPIEEKTNGILVIDASATEFGLIKEPIRLKITDGKVKRIEGSDEANKLRSILENSRDPNSYIIAEFAVGLNDKAKVIGNIIEDEGVYGTGHFALGNNINFGGKNKAPIHLDMVYWKPTIKIDEELIMENGELVNI
ncbi:MAG TPA: aminopeptidase, partial [Thermoanaerobacterales bacterium]|nr:aminopeptidase [Thermoanaerobacterales bacterium]